jgi:ribonuclease HII
VNNKPDFSFETAAKARGFIYIAGCDEVGRGPLAGDVTSAAVILDPNNIPEGLHDSKKLSEKRRELLFAEIMATAQVSIATVSAAVIDQINIRQATFRAMTLAVEGLPVRADHCLIDGNAIPPLLKDRAEFIIKGDAKSLSISAASIIAKVTRDRLMKELSETYPGYGFEKHAGYGVPAHLEAITRLGPCAIHRMTFAPLKTMKAA